MMDKSQHTLDHEPPFRDKRNETLECTTERAQTIPDGILKAWFLRFGRYTHPANYGVSECDKLYSVCWDRWEKPQSNEREARRVGYWDGHCARPARPESAAGNPSAYENGYLEGEQAGKAQALGDKDGQAGLTRRPTEEQINPISYEFGYDNGSHRRRTNARARTEAHPS